jgi:hypothetical protein
MSKSSMQELAEKALAALDQDPAHHLRLGFRQAIWAQFGPRATPEGRLGKAHLQRASLAASAAARVQPLWRHRYGNDELPSTALATIKEITAARLSAQKAQAVFNDLWNQALHVATDDPASEVASGFAAIQAVGAALYDEAFNSNAIDLERLDEDDPENHDAAFYAAAAAAGGMPWDEGSDSHRRFQFWRWWLEKAIEIESSEQFSK